MESEVQALDPLGLEVRLAFESCQDAKSPISPRWETNRRNYHNNPAKREAAWLYTGCADEHIPLVQPLIDTLGSLVLGALFGEEPWCRIDVVDDNDAEAALAVEEAVWAVIGRSDAVSFIKRVFPVAAWSNCGFAWASFEPEKARCKLYESLPGACVVYPPSEPCLEEARLVGRLFTKPHSWVKRKQATGEYLAGAVVKGDTAVDSGVYPRLGTWTKVGSQVLPGDEPVRLLDCVFTETGGAKWRMTVAVDSGAVLKKEQFPESAPVPFGMFRLKEEPEGGAFTDTSVGQDLQALQSLLNESASMLQDGTRYNVMPVTFTDVGAAGPKDYFAVPPGAVVETMAAGNTKHDSPRADLTPLTWTMQFVIQHAERVARTGSMAAGAPLPGDRTAAETNGILAGQSSAADDYLDTFGSSGLVWLFKYVQRSVYANWDRMGRGVLERLGIDLEAIGHEAFAREWNWQPASVSVASRPAAQMAMLKHIVETESALGGGLIDRREMMERSLQLGERMGVVDASNLLAPDDPEEHIVGFARTTGVPPEIVARHMAAAIEEAGQSAQGSPVGGG